MKVAKIKKVLGYALGVQTLKKNIERGEEAIEKIKQQIKITMACLIIFHVHIMIKESASSATSSRNTTPNPY